MTDVARPAALVLAAADNPLPPQLAAELAAQGMGCIVCAQAAQAFIRLARHDAPGGAIVVAIILDGLSGLTVPALAKALRGLPGRTGLPLLLVDEQTPAPFRGLSVRRPVAAADLARLAAMPPDQWTPVAAPTSVPIAPPPVGTDVILVVDDHVVNRTVLSRQARAAGLPVETCADGAAAVARVAAGGVRLVLMDCQMPGMDVYEATRAIRRAEAGSAGRLPIIAVTAFAMTENRQRCLEAGMDDFLAKPLSQALILTVIRRWLGVAPAVVPTATAGPAVSGEILDEQTLRETEACCAGTGRQLACILLADLPPAGEAFQRLLAEGALDQLSREAHRLKGTSGSLGAMQLCQACNVLEQAARGHDREACDRAVAAALQAIAHLQPTLTAFADKLTKA